MSSNRWRIKISVTATSLQVSHLYLHKKTKLAEIKADVNEIALDHGLDLFFCKMQSAIGKMKVKEVLTYNSKWLIKWSDADFNDASTPHFKNTDKRYGFRCNYHYADSTCYGGPDGGDCPSGRRRRGAPKLKDQIRKAQNNVNSKFSLTDGGQCKPGWMEITSQEMCGIAANILGLKLKLQRDNSSAITGCIATEIFEENGNRTMEKAVCQSESTHLKDATEATQHSGKVKLKRAKRQAGD